VPLRVLALVALAAIAGCSSDEVNSPLTFFPGSQPSSWSACDKFGASGDQVLVCATYVTDPTTNVATSYAISFYLPIQAHVHIAVFDVHGALVNVLLDSDELATIGQYRTPPVTWNFTNAHGARVGRGDYRIYFSAGQFLTSSDVAVP
jgi:hypothetical protein